MNLGKAAIRPMDLYECHNGLRFGLEKDLSSEYRYRVYRIRTVKTVSGPPEDMEEVAFVGSHAQCVDFIKEQAKLKQPEGV